jgi:hypothetical protein
MPRRQVLGFDGLYELVKFRGFSEEMERTDILASNLMQDIDFEDENDRYREKQINYTFQKQLMKLGPILSHLNRFRWQSALISRMKVMFL